jgi:hypothetical protein
MAGQPGFFDSDERLRWLSAAGDPLEGLASYKGAKDQAWSVSKVD